jgi:hypothetical protein
VRTTPDKFAGQRTHCRHGRRGLAVIHLLPETLETLGPSLRIAVHQKSHRKHVPTRYDHSKAPYRQANKLPFQLERAILGIKKEFPSWGAPKIRDKLIREYPMIPPPAVSTIHAALDRNGLVKRRKRRRYKACGPPLSAAHTPNGLWCADYKGEFLRKASGMSCKPCDRNTDSSRVYLQAAVLRNYSITPEVTDGPRHGVSSSRI